MSEPTSQTDRFTIDLPPCPLYKIRGNGDCLVLRMADHLRYEPDESVWCAEWSSGKRIDVPAGDLVAIERNQQPSFEERWDRVVAWGNAGEGDALWWLGWWLGGMEHCRSTWYYVAALRRDPMKHGWARDRIILDAASACMCPDMIAPSLTSLREIPELSRGPVGQDWEDAVRAARAAVDVPVTSEQIDEMLALMASGLDEKAAAWQAGVPTSNMQRYAQWPAIAAARERKWRQTPPFPLEGSDNG
jgi:hypothetical protein